MSEDKVVPFRVVERVPEKTARESVLGNLRDALTRLEAIPEKDWKIDAVFVIEQHNHEKGVYFNTWFAGMELNRLEIMGVMQYMGYNSTSMIHWVKGQHEPFYS